MQKYFTKQLVIVLRLQVPPGTEFIYAGPEPSMGWLVCPQLTGARSVSTTAALTPAAFIRLFFHRLLDFYVLVFHFSAFLLLFEPCLRCSSLFYMLLLLSAMMWMVTNPRKHSWDLKQMMIKIFSRKPILKLKLGVGIWLSIFLSTLAAFQRRLMGLET